MKEKKVSFLVDKEELGLLDKVVIFEPYLQEVVRKAKRVKDRYRVKFSVMDLKEAKDALSYAAGCMAKYPENEKMHKLCEKIDAYHILYQALKE